MKYKGCTIQITEQKRGLCARVRAYGIHYVSTILSKDEMLRMVKGVVDLRIAREAVQIEKELERKARRAKKIAEAKLPALKQVRTPRYSRVASAKVKQSDLLEVEAAPRSASLYCMGRASCTPRPEPRNTY